MSRLSRVAPAIGVLGAAAAACVPLPGGRALAAKPVAAKEGEATLVAEDGARCAVPPPRFARARVGDRVRCVWAEAEGPGRVRVAPRIGPGQRTGRR